MAELNAVSRSEQAGGRVPARQQVDSFRQEANQARQQMRKVAALLLLSGPDELASAARAVMDATHELFLLMNEPDEGPHSRSVQPPKVLAASEKLTSATQEFARLARKYTR
jgi:hypothetical protein